MNQVMCEWLESRTLFDASPTGYTPQQARHAYGADSIVFDGGIAGNGAGQTIAIIIDGTHPTAYSDLQAFDAYYGLPDPPSFHRYDEYGGTSSYPNYEGGVEEALDIEWTHVMAPGASIDVFECPNSIGDEWNIAAVNAAKTPGVSVVSMSFGHDEFSGQTGYDGDFTTPSGHAGVTFVSSTGDSGEDNGHTSYAAESPNVVAVGGTVLYLANSSGDYGHEDGWAGSGGGISTQESQPSYQAGKVNGLSSSYRTVPDISMNAGAGESVYDTTDYPPTSPWSNNTGGTSLAAPMFAGLVADADQGRALAGLPSLDGSSQTLPRLYNLPAGDINDIISGSNGYPTLIGYDLVTGLGSPVANKLVNDLAFSASDFTVTNTNDSGTGSLRQAIINANAYNLPVTISFDIPTSSPGYSGGVFTIKPNSSLPELLDNRAIIDGSTQESYTGNTNGGRPVVFVDGGGAAIDGFSVGGTDDGILNLGIDDFRENAFFQGDPIGGAVTIYGTADSVQGCYIGVGPNGTSPANNSGGVIFDGCVNCGVDDGGTGNVNVIGFNNIGVSFDGAVGSLVYNTDIGVTPTDAPVGNATGVEILSETNGFYGNSTGNGVTSSQIDFSQGDGVLLSGSGTQNNFLASDMIGATYSSTIGIAGYYAAGNGGDGVHFSSGASNNSIGLYTGYPTGGPSVIAGNTLNGVEIDDGFGNVIQNTSIGEAAHSIFNGHSFTVTNNPNLQDGIDIHDGASHNSIGSATSVTSPGSTANVISGNGAAGISIADTSSINNTAYGDYIGTDSSGDAIGNAHEGVIIFADQEFVSGCVISDNGYSGLSLPGYSNSVTDDLIGTNLAGSAALGNSHEGIYINGPGNLVQADTISGNAYTGITIAGTSNTVIKGNYIGTNSMGAAAIPNQQQGILVSGGAQLNSISGNIISGNSLQGIALGGSLNSVYSNYIGTNYNVSAAVPNVTGGIYVSGNGQSIGFAGSGNVISGNTTGYGIELDTSAAYGNSIVANDIGANAGGTAALANANGIVIQNGASNNSIGAATSGGGNVISGNSNDGIYITTANSSGNTIVANFIGTNATGTAAIGNGFDGVEVNASSNTIGGTTAAARNIISGNSNRDGLVIEGSGITGDIVEGNFIGTNAAGTAAIPNSSGIEIISSASGDKLIGNVISGNSNRGVGLFGSSSTSSTVQGDWIGTDYTGLHALGNGGIGIYVSGDESVIGGYNTSQGDTVGFNAGGGINIASSNDATVTDSTIYDNSNGGINNAGTLFIYNCTLTANTATNGAGIYTTGTMQIVDSTIVLNTASSTGGGVDVAGGSTLLMDSIVAQNTGGDITGAVYSSSYYNLIGDGTGLSGITSSTPGDQIGTHASPINPLLGPLANNGGATETMAPKPGSPALNAGSGVLPPISATIPGPAASTTSAPSSFKPNPFPSPMPRSTSGSSPTGRPWTFTTTTPAPARPPRLTCCRISPHCPPPEPLVTTRSRSIIPTVCRSRRAPGSVMTDWPARTR